MICCFFQSLVSAFLQTLALVENVRTHTSSLKDLVRKHDHDVRQCIVQLQYSVLSGGSVKTKLSSLPEVCNSTGPTTGNQVDTENSKSSLTNCVPMAESQVVDKTSEKGNVNNNDDDDDDFVVLKPYKKRRHILEDDHSNSVDSVIGIFNQKMLSDESGTDKNEDLTKYPAVHYIGNSQVADIVSRGFKSLTSESISKLISVCCSQKRISTVHIFHCNIHLLLPLKHQVVEEIASLPRDTNSAVEPTKRKRIFLNSDLFDSEEDSNTGFEGKGSNMVCETESSSTVCEGIDSNTGLEGKGSNTVCETESSSTVCEGNDSNTVCETKSSNTVCEGNESNTVCETESSNTACENKGKSTNENNSNEGSVGHASTKNGAKTESIGLGKCLGAFSRFYENMSYLDMMETRENMQVCDRLQTTAGRSLKGTLVAGMYNTLPSHVVNNELDLDIWDSYGSEVETRSACELYKQVETLHSKLEDNSDLSDMCTLPVMKHEDKFTTFDRSSIR